MKNLFVITWSNRIIEYDVFIIGDFLYINEELKKAN